MPVPAPVTRATLCEAAIVLALLKFSALSLLPALTGNAVVSKAASRTQWGGTDEATRRAGARFGRIGGAGTEGASDVSPAPLSGAPDQSGDSVSTRRRQ